MMLQAVVCWRQEALKNPNPPMSSVEADLSRQSGRLESSQQPTAADSLPGWVSPSARQGDTEGIWTSF